MANYNLIEQRITDNAMYIVCVKNEIKSQIKSKQADFEWAANNWPGATKSTFNFFICFSQDFLQNSSNSGALNCSLPMELPYFIQTFDTLEAIHNTSTPPPKHIDNFHLIQV